MKPASFEYFVPRTVDEAVGILRDNVDEARVLAGGQSLVPLMNFRLARPERLVDINGIRELSYVRCDQGKLSIGALTREATIERHPLVMQYAPILAEATRWIGHIAIRHRGTIGGSIAHNDPSAEYPLVAALLDAEIVIAGANGIRVCPYKDFSTSFFTTDLKSDEVITEIRLPLEQVPSGWGFHEVARRHGDFGLVLVGASVTVADGCVMAARMALGGVGPTPFRASAAESFLIGRPLDDETVELASELACEELSPPSDMHGSSEFRRHLGRVLVQRCLKDAYRNAA